MYMRYQNTSRHASQRSAWIVYIRRNFLDVHSGVFIRRIQQNSCLCKFYKLS